MHFAERGRHLLDGADFFDHETVRQKSLIDQLHDALILRLKPDRSKMLTANVHTFWLCYEWRIRPVAGNRRLAATGSLQRLIRPHCGSCPVSAIFSSS